MKRKLKLTIAVICIGILSVRGQNYHFDFTPGKNTKEGYIKITPASVYNSTIGYGYDLLSPPKENGKEPFYFSVTVPDDGNYHVTAIVGSKKRSAQTTVRGESRRLFFENISTQKGELKKCTFTINKRNVHIDTKNDVKIKSREVNKLNWDNKLTIEINGENPQLAELIIEKIEDVPTIFLCGNSTVVDQEKEPWASWGQMITRFFNDSISFANYAESGESANTFIGAKRLAKALTQMKTGDYIFIEFGHNDQKQKGPGKGAYYSYMTSLKIFIDEARARGAHPILITPTQRRRFNSEGKIVNTHGEYPEAMRWLADKENIPVIDLNEITRTLYESMGVEQSKKLFVHYPAGTWPGQTNDLADNTHFNPFGAYEVAKCVIEGMKTATPELMKYLRSYPPFNPKHPDHPNEFHWNLSKFSEMQKPDGN